MLGALGQLLTQDKSWQANHTLCRGMKPHFQVHFQSILAQYSFPVSSLAMDFTLPTMLVACQADVAAQEGRAQGSTRGLTQPIHR